MSDRYEHFNATTVPLKGSNLIEASAGTGKTYSIAIMVLRLIVEKRLNIKDILMVTFTRAAVAELEERVRLFTRYAYKASKGESIKDSTIATIVKEAAAKTSTEEVENLLKTAVLYLDETSVLTIHSFCQQTLTEFALETNQLFGSDTMQDTSNVISEEVNKFWREYITTLPVDLLRYIINAGFSRHSISQVIREHLSGKKYGSYKAAENYELCDDDHQTVLQSLKEFGDKVEELKQCVLEHIFNNLATLQAQAAKNSYAVKARLHEINDAEQLLGEILGRKGSGYIQKIYGEVLLLHGDCDAVQEQLDNNLQEVIQRFLCLAINKVSSGVVGYKQRNNLMSFDDMIVNLHGAFAGPTANALRKALQRKYRAVFVDEFQDTDRLQYEIFQAAFGQGTILFYIGDPKQSIYAWRKADIFTYFKARNTVKTLYSMNENYRSTKLLIEAMNAFFKPYEGFDTFYFRDAQNAIEYVDVESPKENSKGVFVHDGQMQVPITIVKRPNKAELCNAVAAQLFQLLKDKSFTLETTSGSRHITPSDIGVLVRSNTQAKAIKAILSRYGIPAVTIDDGKILQSEEAAYVLYLLQAMVELTTASMRKALLSPFTGYTITEIEVLDDEVVIELFRKYRSRWDKDGVYTALMDFVSDFGVRKQLLQANTENGERIITNLFQLIEVVHKVQTNKNLSPLELISWLQRGRDGMETEGDEFEQRLENDEEAVKIVTIHKSKGLQYNIVFAPFLDFIDNKYITIHSFRDPLSGEYISHEKKHLSDEQKKWVEEQSEQENRRLLYVAITRAVYKCFVYKNEWHKNSTLVTFLNALVAADQKLIAYEDVMPLFASERYARAAQWEPPKPSRKVPFKLLHDKWTRMSFTRLAAKAEAPSKPAARQAGDAYDNFIFRQLERGAKTGNMLHYILENIDFTSDSQWSYVLDDALNTYMPRQKDSYKPVLLQMLQEVLQTEITIGGDKFTLANVRQSEKIHEFEFDFNVPLFDPQALTDLADASISIAVKQPEQMEGVMNGKIDLLFRCKGKFYILDWKSNYLGDTLEAYEPGALLGAMNEHNYHLQYYIYSLAAKKYLETRIAGFNWEQHFGGVIYLFLRGVRKGQPAGKFITRPTEKQVKNLEAALQLTTQSATLRKKTKAVSE